MDCRVYDNRSREDLLIQIENLKELLKQAKEKISELEEKLSLEEDRNYEEVAYYD